MWAIAIIADCLGFIPGIGGLIGDVFAFIGFNMVGANVQKGGLFSPEQVGVSLITMVLEVPLGMLPLWTFRVMIYKWQTRETGPWMQGGWQKSEEERY